LTLSSAERVKILDLFPELCDENNLFIPQKKSQIGHTLAKKGKNWGGKSDNPGMGKNDKRSGGKEKGEEVGPAWHYRPVLPG
jgi:hypothetical protein